MGRKEFKAALNIIAAIAAFAGAIFWYRASVAVVRPNRDVDSDGWYPAQIVVKHVSFGEFDPFATGIEQSRLNKLGASAASIAALLQGLALLIPD